MESPVRSPLRQGTTMGPMPVNGHHGEPNAAQLPFHVAEPLRRTFVNRVFAVVYATAILALVHRHSTTLVHSPSVASFSISAIFLISDLILAFLWIASQSTRLFPIRRREFPENLKKVIVGNDSPALDVFVCTADPYKEPPMVVVNTALSLMAYDYPADKLSVYVSDDGGSAITLFALMEAAKFARHWLPFCRKEKIPVRNPAAYMESCSSPSSDAHHLKIMYESMKVKVEQVLERGKVGDECMTNDEEHKAYLQWNSNFTRHDHPTVIQVLLENSKDKDIEEQLLPNFIYVSREKCKTSPHHFKAGALNVLLRVSAILTNAPLVLTQDCDMYSNDPETPIRVMCYYKDEEVYSKCAYVQLPQHFQGINKDDIYASQFKYLFQIRPMGFDGLMGPNHVGTGCFFSRRALFGNSSSFEIPQLDPLHVVGKPIGSQQNLELTCLVSSNNYEDHTSWGSKVGFRYGSLVEDFFTGYRLHCEGWRAIFCNPTRRAFLGDAPNNLMDLLNQQKRWAVGVLDVGFSKYCPLTFGIKHMGLLMSLAYAQYAFWPLFAIPISIYVFIPQVALLNGVFIFPKVSEPWFLLYLFLFISAYGQDFVDFVLAGSTFWQWWNDQRIWMIRGLSCLLLGLTEFIFKSFGFSMIDFNITRKVTNEEQTKRYDQGIFDFGIHSSMIVPLVMAALINLASLVWGLAMAFYQHNFDCSLLQILLSGCVVVNCWPIYESMIWRNDGGKLPLKTSIFATFFVFIFYIATSFLFSK